MKRKLALVEVTFPQRGFNVHKYCTLQGGLGTRRMKPEAQRRSPRSPSGPPRPANLCSVLRSALVCECVCGVFSFSTRSLSAHGVVIARRPSLTEGVSWLSGVREAPAESTVDAQKIRHKQTDAHTAASRRLQKYVARNIDTEVFTPSYGHHGKMNVVNDFRSR